MGWRIFMCKLKYKSRFLSQNLLKVMSQNFGLSFVFFLRRRLRSVKTLVRSIFKNKVHFPSTRKSTSNMVFTLETLLLVSKMATLCVLRGNANLKDHIFNQLAIIWSLKNFGLVLLLLLDVNYPYRMVLNHSCKKYLDRRKTPCFNTSIGSIWIYRLKIVAPSNITVKTGKYLEKGLETSLLLIWI